jgi:glutathione synthase/RimK-type ligase-like ATP-grasp enzyme
MTAFDLCLAWNWEYDLGFARLLEAACVKRGLSLLQVTDKNLESTLQQLQSGELRFAALLDRASDSDERFQPLVDWVLTNGVFQINPQALCRWAWDKATMHLEFITAGLETPYTIILSPKNEQPNLPELDLTPFGSAFNIKPAVGGGGWGVVMHATSCEQVQQARSEYPEEKVLVQAHIEPEQLEGRAAWFRVLVCNGAVYPCWWDTTTHVYTRLTAQESFRFGLGELKQVARRIEQLCGLHLFSTEIALSQGKLIVTDYVNDPLDLRLLSEAVDGVPDEIVVNICARLARLAQQGATNPPTVR